MERQHPGQANGSTESFSMALLQPYVIDMHEACRSASELACHHPSMAFLVVFGLIAFVLIGATLAAWAATKGTSHAFGSRTYTTTTDAR